MLVGSGAYGTLVARKRAYKAILFGLESIMLHVGNNEIMRIVSAKVEMKYVLWQSLRFLVLTKLQ